MSAFDYLVSGALDPLGIADDAYFVGRDQVLQKVSDTLRSGDSRVCLYGMPGAGKTRTVERFITCQGTRYPGGVFWVAAHKPPRFGLVEALNRLTTAAHPDPGDQPFNPIGLTVEPDSLPGFIATAFRERSRARGPVILVLDDLNSVDDWSDFLRLAGDSIQVVATSWAAITAPKWTAIPLEPLDWPDIRKLLTMRSVCPAPDSDEEAACKRTLLQSLGGVVAYVRRAAEYVVAANKAYRGSARESSAWRQLERDHRAVVLEASPHEIAKSIGYTKQFMAMTRLHIRLARASADAWTTLHVRCVLDRSEVPESLLESLVPFSVDRLRSAIEVLADMDLVEYDSVSGSTSVHFPIWEEVRSQLRTSDWNSAIVRSLEYFLPLYEFACASAQFTPIRAIASHASAAMAASSPAADGPVADRLHVRHALYLIEARGAGRAGHSPLAEAQAVLSQVIDRADGVPVELLFEAQMQRLRARALATTFAKLRGDIEALLNSPLARRALEEPAVAQTVVSGLLALAEAATVARSVQEGIVGLATSFAAAGLATRTLSSKREVYARTLNMVGLAFGRLGLRDEAGHAYELATSAWQSVHGPAAGQLSRAMAFSNLGVFLRHEAERAFDKRNLAEIPRLIGRAFDSLTEAISVDEAGLGVNHPRSAVRRGIRACAMAHASTWLSARQTLALGGRDRTSEDLIGAALDEVRATLDLVTAAGSWFDDGGERASQAKLMFGEVSVFAGLLDQAIDPLLDVAKSLEGIPFSPMRSDPLIRAAELLCQKLVAQGRRDEAADLAEGFLRGFDIDATPLIAARALTLKRYVSLLEVAGQQAKADEVRHVLRRTSTDVEHARLLFRSEGTMVDALASQRIGWLEPCLTDVTSLFCGSQ